MAADFVLFEPAVVADRADWNAPRAHAAGIRTVVINGIAVVGDGRFLGGSHGTVLRRGSN